MDKDQWKIAEERATSQYGYCKFLVDAYKVSLQLAKVSPYKNMLAVYVNGKIRGEWLEKKTEECTRFYYHTTKSMLRSHCKGKKRKELLKVLGMTEEELQLDFYSPFYPSFALFKRQLIARNKDIQLLEE